MLPPEVVRQIHRLELQSRRVVRDLFAGRYHSAFKGAGVAFDEVREYEPGDDPRGIDWNVSARMGHLFVKRYAEERERTVLLLVDGSASLDFGSGVRKKREVAAELAAVLAFSAIRNQDRVGLLTFTERVERFVPPRKGTRHVLRLIRDVLVGDCARAGTDLRAALDHADRVLRRRSIVFLVSDFLDGDFESALRRMGRKHDLIAVHVGDPLEDELPAVGLVEFEDSETGERMVVDTGSRRVRAAYAARARARREGLRRLARAAAIDLVEATSTGNHLEALIRFFESRQRRWRGRN